MLGQKATLRYVSFMRNGFGFRVFFISFCLGSSAIVLPCSKDNKNTPLKRLLNQIGSHSFFSDNQEFRHTPSGVEMRIGGVKLDGPKLIERHGLLIRKIEYDFFELFEDGWGMFSKQVSQFEWEFFVSKKVGLNFELKQTLGLRDSGNISNIKIVKGPSGNRYMYFSAGQHFVKVELNINKPLKTEVFPVVSSLGYIDMKDLNGWDGVRGVLRFSEEQVHATFNPEIRAFTFSPDGKFLFIVFSGQRKSEGAVTDVGHGLLIELSQEPFFLNKQARLVGIGLMRDSPFADFTREGERASRVLVLPNPIKSVSDLRVEPLLRDVQGLQSYVVKARLGFLDGTDEFIRIVRLNLAFE